MSTYPPKQAIRTKFHGATNYRDSRVTAATCSGLKLTLPWDDELDAPENHRKAAEALCKKLQWSGRLVQGALSDSYVFVFAA